MEWNGVDVVQCVVASWWSLTTNGGGRLTVTVADVRALRLGGDVAAETSELAGLVTSSLPSPTSPDCTQVLFDTDVLLPNMPHSSH